MTIELKKEILKANYFGFTAEQISKIYDIDIKTINEIIEEGEKYIKELEERFND